MSPRNDARHRRPTDARVSAPVLLVGTRSVTVTREEPHQAVLAGYSGRVVAELGFCRIDGGKYLGERGIEVRLDGRRVGELTFRMSERYGHAVGAVLDSGRVPTCAGQVERDHRGIQVTLLLPDASELTSQLPAPRRGSPPDPRPDPPAPRPGHAPTRTEPPTIRLPRVPAPTRVTPHGGAPAPVPGGIGHGPSVALPTAPARTRRKAPWIAGGAVAAVLLVIGLNSGSDDSPEITASPPTTAVAAPASLPATPPTTPPTTTAPPTTVPTTAAGTAGQAAPPRTAEAPRRTAAPQTQAPAPQQAPAPRQVPPPQQEPAGGECDPNYTGCVPVASDVDCAGGGGDGPAYVRGPVQVIGTDVYRLDADKDGTACE